jgi:hypothetical protein
MICGNATGHMLVSVRVHHVPDHVFWSQRWVNNAVTRTHLEQEVAIDCNEGAYRH